MIRTMLLLLAVFVAGCGDDDPSAPETGLTLGDLVGSWIATSNTHTNNANAAESFDMIEFKDGRVFDLTYDAAWYSRNVPWKYDMQFRCKICPDGVGGAADVVCADAWECDEAGYPLFDERDGSSLILSRTEKEHGHRNAISFQILSGGQCAEAPPQPVKKLQGRDQRLGDGPRHAEE